MNGSANGANANISSGSHAAATWLPVLLFVTLTRWGTGVHKRRVVCPENNNRATVVVEYTETAESGFGSVQATDIKACSVFPNSPVNCEKECLSHL